MAGGQLVKVALSDTNLDRRIERGMEPRAATPSKRLDAIRQLAEAGIPVTVMVAPIIPALTDSEIERILEAAYEAGAREAGYVLLRLPLEIRDLFREWLLEHHPGRLRHILSLVQSTRGGKDYDATFGKRMVGEGVYAGLIQKRFKLATTRLGFGRARLALRTDLFQKPVKAGDQLSLFA